MYKNPRTQYGSYYEKESVYPIDNILGLEQPETFRCEITAFQKTHQFLTIFGSSEDPALTLRAFRLTFSGIRYTELFDTWYGMNISVAPPDECLSLLRHTLYFDENLAQHLLNGYTLFVFHTPNRDLRIVASSLTAQPFDNLQEYLQSFRG